MVIPSELYLNVYIKHQVESSETTSSFLPFDIRCQRNKMEGHKLRLNGNGEDLIKVKEEKIESGDDTIDIVENSFIKKEVIKDEPFFIDYEEANQGENYENKVNKRREYKRKKCFQCAICWKEFLDSFKLKRHISTHSTKTRFLFAQSEMDYTDHKLCSCKICLRNTFLKKQYNCKQCEKKFSTASGLRNHARSHTGEKNYECKICFKIFYRGWALKKHHATHTGEKQFKCEFCEKNFSRSDVLNKHIIRKHNGEKVHECPSCGKKFATLYELKSHKIFAHTERGLSLRFACESCGKTFFTFSNLKSHMIIHSEKKPYKCEFCDSKFYFAGNLKKHGRVHSEERPYACELCEVKYKSPRCLKRHMLTHT